MNQDHPNQETWMSYLYDETEGAERAELREHLRHCEVCAAQIQAWQSARARLSEWRLAPAAARGRESVLPLPGVSASLHWAAAAALLITAGFVAGRAGSATQAGKLRAALEPQIRRELRQEFSQMLSNEVARASADTVVTVDAQTRELLAAYDRASEARRAASEEDLYDEIDRLQSQHLADYLSLKKDLDTVAINTDAGLRNQQQQLAYVASAERPASFSAPAHQ